MKNSINKQSGFTIIELVLIMVVIGILSAVALPRLFNLGGQARKTVVISLNSSLRTAAELAYSQWIASGQPASIKVDTDDFYTGTLGYPINTGTAAKTLDTTECLNLWNKLLKNPPAASITTGCASSGECKFEVTLDNSTCTFTDQDNNYLTYDTATGNTEYTLAS